MCIFDADTTVHTISTKQQAKKEIQEENYYDSSSSKDIYSIYWRAHYNGTTVLTAYKYQLLIHAAEPKSPSASLAETLRTS
jgi:hypothetical protein